MNISLTPELEQLIAAKVASGYYHSSSEVVREGLRLLIERDELKQKRIEMLNHEIQKGIDAENTGRLINGEDAYKELMEECDKDIKNAL